MLWNEAVSFMYQMKTPKSPLNSKEIKQVNINGNKSWIVTGKTDVETPVFWSSDSNRWLIGKVHDTGNDRGQKEKRVSDDEMYRQCHWFNERELLGKLGDAEGQGSLVCCSSWGCKEPDTTEWLNNKKLKHITNVFKCHLWGPAFKNTSKWAREKDYWV